MTTKTKMDLIFGKRKERIRFSATKRAALLNILTVTVSLKRFTKLI